MKTLELTAAEINLSLSVEDISNIPFDPEPDFPADSFALKSLKTGLHIRGVGKNLFVCGPSAPERISEVLKAAKTMKPGTFHDLVLCESPEDPLRPVIRKLEPGTAANFIVEEKSAGRSASILTSSIDPPVIIEDNPVPFRLFGCDATEISEVCAGSLAGSAGGLLLLNAEDLLDEEESWKLLKRVLRTNRSYIGAEASGAAAKYPAAGKDSPDSKYLRLPEIELDLKVIILGSEAHFDHFYNTDEDFRELFQFFTEFDSVIESNDKNIRDSVNCYRSFSINKLGKRLSDEAALEMIKFSVASAENNTKLSTLISEAELILCEADTEAVEEATAEEDPQNCITASQVRNAIKNQGDRFSLLERRIIEDLKSGEINLQVEGLETGKVNGLAIIDKGPWSFGFPGLISARIAPGENGLVNIEHEAGLSGEIHDKWVLILEGFLRSRFALDFPISIFASICFEQSYSEVDGDSASSSELYALLSAISGIPLRQDIAVTGSLSQTGEIQAVGGLREKIEGFYKACKAINFTGEQGVIIPERNIKNIILPDEIINDIAGGRFHIYPVSTVNDSMEILTGIESGQRNSRGSFPHGSLNYLVEKNLKKLAVQAKNSGN